MNSKTIKNTLFLILLQTIIFLLTLLHFVPKMTCLWLNHWEQKTWNKQLFNLC